MHVFTGKPLERYVLKRHTSKNTVQEDECACVRVCLLSYCVRLLSRLTYTIHHNETISLLLL